MAAVSRHSRRTAVGRRTNEIVTTTGADLKRMRLDAGLSQRQLAAAAAIDHGFLSQIERGLREPSLAVLVAISASLGGDLSVRVYPGTGPRIRDPLQARMVEAVLKDLDPRWTRHLEVPVYRPVRGVIDLVIEDPQAILLGATELQSELRRLEQQLRWSHEKVDALPSSSIWRFPEPGPKVDRLLIVRNTRANRAIVDRFATTLATDYPARTIDAYRALTTADAPWAGSAILWVSIDGDDARLMDRPPRGVSVGRLPADAQKARLWWLGANESGAWPASGGEIAGHEASWWLGASAWSPGGRAARPRADNVGAQPPRLRREPEGSVGTGGRMNRGAMRAETTERGHGPDDPCRMAREMWSLGSFVVAAVAVQ